MIMQNRGQEKIQYNKILNPGADDLQQIVFGSPSTAMDQLQSALNNLHVGNAHHYATSDARSSQKNNNSNMIYSSMDHN